jgi:hypothetical protein
MIEFNQKKLKRWRAFGTEELRIIAAKLGEQVSSKEEETLFKDAFEAFCERQGIQPLWDKKSGP